MCQIFKGSPPFDLAKYGSLNVDPKDLVIFDTEN